MKNSRKTRLTVVTLFAIAMVLSGMSMGQVQNHFTVAVGAGMSSASSGSGVIASLEPGIRPDRRVAIGLRMEYMNAPAASLGSLSGSMHWYLNDAKWRVLLGLGGGFFRITSKQQELPVTSSFGCYPRLGVETGRFLLLLEYNFLVMPLPQGSPVALQMVIPGFAPSGYKDNRADYVGVKLAYLFGRGVNNQ